jgi:2-polyprenyl-3-methyl-5-hydroxy-6-metoxy-1,4-benzoquinol methylase
MDLRNKMEQIYSDLPPQNIPWNLAEPPDLLVEAVASGKIKPCRTADLGCGTGNYAIWMARQGFEIIGIDFSRNAVKLAQESAAREKVDCRFEVADLLGDMSRFYGGFDFAYDWELLHHIFPDDRTRYLKNVHNLLRPDGQYLSVAFSETDPSFGGTGQYRDTPLGTKLYFSSIGELQKLYTPLFDIMELTVIEIPGSHGPHMAHKAWLKPL